MLILGLCVAAVAVLFVVTVRTRADGRAVLAKAWTRRRRTESVAVDAGPAPALPDKPKFPATPECMEGMLVALLLDGEITSDEYRRAAEELAAQDQAGHPFAVPPDL